MYLFEPENHTHIGSCDRTGEVERMVRANAGRSAVVWAVTDLVEWNEQARHFEGSAAQIKHLRGNVLDFPPRIWTKIVGVSC